MLHYLKVFSDDDGFYNECFKSAKGEAKEESKVELNQRFQNLAASVPEFKKEWEKVEFKNEYIAILKGVWGRQSSL